MGLGLKDSPPGFDPSQVANSFGTDEDDDQGDDGSAWTETEQL
jgi:DNA-directed RNA polymerase subunit alpha